MKPVVLFLTFGAFSLLAAIPVSASHSNEGQLGLEDLLKEAMTGNPRVQAAQLAAEAAKKEARAQRGDFFPEISVEGGELKTKYDRESQSGTALYGKVEWNLYRGGRDQAMSQIKSAEAERSRYTSDLMQNGVNREIAANYYEMLFILESLDLKERALLMNAEQMKLARTKKQSGFTSSADVIEFELREATLRSDMLELNQQKSEKSRALSILLGRPDPAAELSLRGHLLKESFHVDRKTFLSQLDSANPELNILRSELVIAEKQKDVARAGFLPEVNLEAIYGKIPNEERVFEDRDNYSVFLKVKLPVFSGMITANELGVAQARLKQKEILASVQHLSVKSEAEALLARMDSLQERLRLEESTLQKSEDYYKITLGEYRRGVKNSPDMVGAAERLLEARLRNLEFRRDFYLTKLRLLGLTGAALSQKT